MLKGHLPRVTCHHVYKYTKITFRVGGSPAGRRPSCPPLGLPSKYDPQQTCSRNPHSRPSGKTPARVPLEAPSSPYFCWLFQVLNTNEGFQQPKSAVFSSVSAFQIQGWGLTSGTPSQLPPACAPPLHQGSGLRVEGEGLRVEGGGWRVEGKRVEGLMG